MSESTKDSESVEDQKDITPKTINYTIKQTSKLVKSKMIL
jgi:hypothetical protein